MLACPLAHTLSYTCCWLINIRDFVLFLNLCSFFLPSHQSFSFFLPLHFFFTPPTPCRSLFTSSTLVTFPTCFSQLPFSACCSLCCLCLSAVVRVSWTDGVCVACCPNTHGQTHTQTQRHTRVAVLFPPPRPVKPGKYCSSALLPPPCPRCGRDHKPNGLSPLSCGDHRSRDLDTV